MDASTLALMIPIIGVSIPIVAIWTSHRQKIAKMEIEATATQIEALRDTRETDAANAGVPLNLANKEKA
jgi:hypothetical protein